MHGPSMNMYAAVGDIDGPYGQEWMAAKLLVSVTMPGS